MPEMPNTPQAASSADDAIAALRPSFLASLKTQLEELKAHRENIAAGEIDDNSRQAMRFTVHAMRGTAASYFFPAIPETAGPLERAIVAGDAMTDDSVLAMMDNLIKMCADALDQESAA